MMSDKDVLGSALTILKHQSHMYHGLSEQTGNLAFLREVSSLMQEKQEQRLRVFQAMNQRGWYNPQLISNQQLQQHKSQTASQQRQLQQQLQQHVSSPNTGHTQWQPSPAGMGSHVGMQGSSAHHHQPWGSQFHSSPLA